MFTANVFLHCEMVVLVCPLSLTELLSSLHNIKNITDITNNGVGTSDIANLVR